MLRSVRGESAGRMHGLANHRMLRPGLYGPMSEICWCED